MKFQLSILLFLLLLIQPILAKSDATLYLLPTEKKEALSTLLHTIDLAHNEIKVSIYSFTNKKIADRLKNAARRGVHVEIIFDESESRSKRGKSMIGYLAKYRHIKVYRLQGLGSRTQKRKYRGIMHIKMAVIDQKWVIFGSANWTYKAFSKNYETLFIAKDYAMAKKFLRFFEKQKELATPYR